ncbi:MAG: radical SAM protein, partial [Planctomycetes bacterium]|nr:radical SAM protein [Planctomycetota bacterium]
CDYCDTPLCHVKLDRARVEVEAGRRVFESWPNPVSLDRLLQGIERLAGPRGLHHSASFTGGEPLLHARTVAACSGRVRELGMKVYLETNGHLDRALAPIVDSIDIVGMDIKIASTTGLEPDHAANRRFLEVATRAGCEVFVKIVVGCDTSDDELGAALAVVSDVALATPVILQPVTPFRGHGVPPDPDRLLLLQEFALTRIPDVAVIPQTHKMLNQL